MTNPTELLPCPKGWRLVPVEPTPEMLEAVAPTPAHWDMDGDDRHLRRAAVLADQMTAASHYRTMLSAAPAPVASEEVERDALERPGRFSDYATTELAAQCRMQARENLDPEYSQFMTAVSQRLLSLTTPARAVSRDEVEEAVHRVIVRWSNGEQPQSLRAMVADAIMELFHAA